eukprot:m.327616 g.327616  ORF g.327616 m.327616 type:complete len:470 (-) comp20418_c0_seq1:248-1657(-)
MSPPSIKLNDYPPSNIANMSPPNASHGGGMFCGKSCDVAFAYETQKVVVIQDRRLGLLKLFLMLAISGYILVYQLLYQCHYLKIEAPVGTSRFSLREPTLPGQNCDTVKHNSCVNDIPPVDQIPYCAQNPTCSSTHNFKCMNCTYWDALQVKNIQDKSILVTTHVQRINQTRNACGSEPPENPAATCPRTWENAAATPSDFFIAGIENFTLLLDHAITTPSLGIEATSRNMSGKLYVKDNDGLCQSSPNSSSNTAPCYIIPQEAISLDFFTVGELLRSGDVDLGDLSAANHSYRDYGCVVLVEINYINYKPWTGTHGGAIEYVYTIKLLPSSSYKYEEEVYSIDMMTREVLTKYGIRFVVLQTGQLGKFDATTTLIALTTSLGLLAVSTLIVDFLATNVFKDKEVYSKSKIQTVKNPDFHTVNKDGFSVIYEDDQPTTRHEPVKTGDGSGDMHVQEQADVPLLNIGKRR